MVMKELIRCDEETQKTFLKEVCHLPQKNPQALNRAATYYKFDACSHILPHYLVFYQFNIICIESNYQLAITRIQSSLI